MPQHPIAGDPTKFRELMIGQASLRDLPAAYVIDSKGTVKVAVLEDDRIPYVAPPAHLIQAAEAGHVPLLMPLKLQGWATKASPTICCPSTWSATPSAGAWRPSPSCATIPTPISTSPAASIRRSCAICARPTKAWRPTRSCSARAAACSSRTACSTS